MTIFTSNRGGVRLSRRVVIDPQGEIRLIHRFEGDGKRVLATHSAGVIAKVEIERGRLSFPLASGTIEAERSFLLTLPPRGVLPMQFDGATVVSDGIVSFDRRADAAFLDADVGVVEEIAEARRLLHERLSDPAPVRSTARDVGLAPETLTRLFSRNYAIGPKEYIHRARLFAALVGILAGARIADSALESGFGDISRFYRHFRRLIGATPGAYARIRKRQDSTSSRGY